MSSQIPAPEEPASPGTEGATDPYEVTSYDYPLPEARIAQVPAKNREDARMLVVDRATGLLTDAGIRDLPKFIREDDLLVLNDTRVVKARILGVRTDTGGRVEVLFTTFGDATQTALLKTRGQLAAGATIRIDRADANPVTLVAEERLAPGMWRVRSGLASGELLAWLEAAGQPPLPPYIHRERAGDARSASDVDRYQTVFAERPGAVAAPTAGLHLTTGLLSAIAARGATQARVTLHVGLGTFKPVTVTDVRQHVMHAEWFEVPQATADAANAARARGGRVVGVGTTSVRALESCWTGTAVEARAGETRLFIHPPMRVHAVDVLLTNFHVPMSTLFMLVAAFAGRDLMVRAYKHAVDAKYRLLSYGDAMLIL